MPALYCIVPAFVLVNTLLDREQRTEGLAGLSFIALGVFTYYLFGLQHNKAR